ncbi:hypothetical protein B0J14DRAFT_336520 [Halenospora varia]|nr:hypothetical protein B0J14DRAFT_336520 [Halenospora varia]
MGMTKRTPLLLVSHLPSASSYYASLLQPLGLVFLFSSSPTATPSPHETLHFGYPTNSPTTQNTVLFSVAQSHEPTVRPASIYLETPSPQACVEFHRKAEKLNRGSGEKGSIEAKDRDPETGEEEVVESRCKDFDGNLVIARYSGSSSARNLGSVNAMDKEVRRVLEWQSDVARSAADSVSTVKAGGHPGPGSLRRSATEPAREPNYIHDLSAGGGGSNGPGGFSGKAILGTILGAAAGAAVAYAMVRSESPDPVPHHTVSYIPAPAAYTHRRSLVSEGQRSGVTANQENIRPRYVARYAIDEGGAPDAPTAVSKRELERIEERTYVSRPPRSTLTSRIVRGMTKGVRT